MRPFTFQLFRTNDYARIDPHRILSIKDISNKYPGENVSVITYMSPFRTPKFNESEHIKFVIPYSKLEFIKLIEEHD